MVFAWIFFVAPILFWERARARNTLFFEDNYLRFACADFLPLIYADQHRFMLRAVSISSLRAQRSRLGT
jgi:hypothetical protein